MIASFCLWFWLLQPLRCQNELTGDYCFPTYRYVDSLFSAPVLQYFEPRVLDSQSNPCLAISCLSTSQLQHPSFQKAGIDEWDLGQSVFQTLGGLWIQFLINRNIIDSARSSHTLTGSDWRSFTEDSTAPLRNMKRTSKMLTVCW